MPLTDIAIRQAKAAEKPFKLSDGGAASIFSLLLRVASSGGWRTASMGNSGSSHSAGIQRSR